MTHSEIRATYEAMRSFHREILIVGPGIVTAVEMADYLRRDRDEA